MTPVTAPTACVTPVPAGAYICDLGYPNHLVGYTNHLVVSKVDEPQWITYSNLSIDRYSS
jgi:hypothetical protein